MTLEPLSNRERLNDYVSASRESLQQPDWVSVLLQLLM